jgi:hypothetical protein
MIICCGCTTVFVYEGAGEETGEENNPVKKLRIGSKALALAVYVPTDDTKFVSGEDERAVELYVGVG